MGALDGVFPLLLLLLLLVFVFVLLHLQKWKSSVLNEQKQE